MEDNNNGPSHRSKVRDHYNSHVDPKLGTREALDRRAKGEAAPLKKFHNDIKRLLLKKFATNAGSLLDLCCGRGGDLHKWQECGIHYVKGVDIAEMEVVEAARRFGELQARSSEMQMVAEFEACSELGETQWNDGNQYDVVTCMFAMHYFFEGERNLKQFLANVANSMAPGGYFVGTIPDGKRALSYLQGFEYYSTHMLQLKKLWKDNAHEVQPWGHQYLCAITDTVTEAKGDSQGSVEFLTFFRPILLIAARLGLEPVLDYEDRMLSKCFDRQDMNPPGAPFKHFRPHFPNSDPSLEAASGLFVAFAFRKTTDPPPSGSPGSMPGPPPGPPPGGGGWDPEPGTGQQSQGTKRPAPPMRSSYGAPEAKQAKVSAYGADDIDL